MIMIDHVCLHPKKSWDVFIGWIHPIGNIVYLCDSSSSLLYRKEGNVGICWVG